MVEQISDKYGNNLGFWGVYEVIQLSGLDDMVDGEHPIKLEEDLPEKIVLLSTHKTANKALKEMGRIKSV